MAVAWLLLAWSLPGQERQVLNFNPEWRFIRADPLGAGSPDCDERGWTNVSAPHTFNDADTFDDWSLIGHRGELNQWAGRTWYRKTFSLPELFRSRKVFVEFEAARQVAEVYLNGKLLGISRNGFIPFGFDLTPHLRFDGPNVLAVMCDNRFMKDPGPEERSPRKGRGGDATGGLSLSEISARVNATIPEDVASLSADQIPWNNPHWHPAHGGLYRNVRLIVTDPLHISLPLYSFLQTAGPYAYPTEISTNSANIGVELPIQNERRSREVVEAAVQVLGPDGNAVLELAQTNLIEAGASSTFKFSGSLRNPQLWAPDHPWLYSVVCRLKVGGKLADACEIPLGLRTAQWNAQTGLSFNGKPLKLRGWGHKPTDEWAGLGAAQPDWMHFFTLNLMKEAGANFVRWGHCAGPPASVAAADRLGIITDQPGVDGESDTRGAAWTIRVAAFRDLLIYYRNHPSILIWEGGNQKVTREHARELSSLVQQYDPHGGRAYAHRRADAVTAEFMQVGIGTEGGREIASLAVVEGEYNREESPRRVWDDFSPPNFGYPEGKGQTYHLTSEQYAVNQVSQFMQKLGPAYHCGGANWIFADSTSGGRVNCEVARTSGEVDGARLPKEAYYVCRTLFRADPQVHIIGHWSYPPGACKPIFVASNAEEVELLINGKSLGRAKLGEGYLATFTNVVWEPGEIRAVARRGGVPVAQARKTTAGAAVKLRLTPLTGPGGLWADGSDVALMDVEALDAQGERCPTFQQRVSFETTGSGIWLGGYNSGRPNSVHRTDLDLECGINRVAIRATRTPGPITVRATCPGLSPGEVTLTSLPLQVEHGFSRQLPQVPASPSTNGAKPEGTTLRAAR